MRIFLLFFWIFLYPIVCAAQAVFTHYGQTQGLADGYIYAIGADKDGFLMVGTGQGVGVLTQKFIGVSQGIIAEPTTALHTSHIAGTWAGTQSGKLYKKSKNARAFTLIKMPAGLDMPIKNIIEDDDQSIWVAYQSGIIVRIQNNTPTIFRCKNQIIINDFEHIGGQQFAVATNIGLCVMRVQANKMTYITVPNLAYNFTCIETKNNDKGWYAGTRENGFFDFENINTYTEFTIKNGLQSNYITDIKRRTYRNIYQKNKEELWITTDVSVEKYEKSINTWAHATTYAAAVFFENSKPSKLYTDAQQHLWVGTYSNGVYFFEGDAIIQKTNAPKKPTYLVHTPTGYWCANDAGLYKIDNALQKTQLVRPYPINKITALAYDSLNNCLWVGTVAAGIQRFDANTMAHTPAPINQLTTQHITEIQPDNQGGVWAATTADGLFYIHPKKQVFAALNMTTRFETNSVRCLNTQIPNTLYANAIGKGLVCINYTTTQNQPLKYTLKNIPTADTIDILQLEHYDKTLLVCTKKSGILAYNNAQNALQKFEPDSTINASKSIYEILCTNTNQLWLGTKKGIIKYDKTQNPSYKFYKINAHQDKNTAADNIIMIRNIEKNVVFGDNTGLYDYQPKNDNNINGNTQLFIQKLTIGNKDYTYNTEEISLPDGNYDVSLNCFLMNYSYQEHNMYAYTLHSKQSHQYIKTKENTIKYNNLPPGKYTLTIQGITQNGFVECPTKTIEFRINIPFYREWWALPVGLLIMLVLISLSYFGYQKNSATAHENMQKDYEEQKTYLENQNNQKDSIIHKITAQKNENESRINRLMLTNEELKINISRRAEELHETSREFAAYVYRTSHDLNGPIARVEGLIELYKATNKPDYIAKHIQEPIKELRQKFNELHEIVRMQERTAKSEDINIGSLIDTAVKVFDHNDQLRELRYNKPTNINITTDIQTKVQSDAEILGIALHEVLKNAIQHSETTTQQNLNIHIYTTETAQHWIIDITDNGGKIIDYIRENMFTMFYKGTIKSDGMGVGLTKARSSMRCIEGNLIYKTDKIAPELNIFSIIIKKPIKNLLFDA